jgi:hypothetical protein
MTPITLSLPLDQTAEQLAAQLREMGAQAWPLPVDLIEAALVEWAVLELEHLMRLAPSYLQSADVHGRRLQRALWQATVDNQHRPPLRGLRERREAARQLAFRFHRKPEAWQLLDTWSDIVGCLVCHHDGPLAPCWGKRTCHGFENGCGCLDCFTRRRIDALEAKEATVTDW